MSKTMFGTWIWGGVTVLLAIVALGIVGYAGWHIVGVGQDKLQYAFEPGTSQRAIGLFYALKENGSLVAGVLGFSGLAWSHFYKAPAPRLDEGV